MGREVRRPLVEGVGEKPETPKPSVPFELIKGPWRIAASVGASPAQDAPKPGHTGLAENPSHATGQAAGYSDDRVEADR